MIILHLHSMIFVPPTRVKTLSNKTWYNFACTSLLAYSMLLIKRILLYAEWQYHNEHQQYIQPLAHLSQLGCDILKRESRKSLIPSETTSLFSIKQTVIIATNIFHICPPNLSFYTQKAFYFRELLLTVTILVSLWTLVLQSYWQIFSIW